MRDDVISLQERQYPSLYRLRCPHCGSDQFKILGKKGAAGKAVAVAGAAGAIGNLAANFTGNESGAFEPVNYRCGQCGKKFEAAPLAAEADEILADPCTVVFRRLSSLAGMAAQWVWLNGVKMGAAGNGKTLEFEIRTKYNILFVTDQYGVAFKDDYRFEARSGGTAEVSFKRKFQ